MNNSAVITGSFYYKIDDNSNTLLLVERSYLIMPPKIKELDGFIKSKFFNDWEIHEDTKQGRTT